MVTSRQLADVVGDALGIAWESAQLHLKTIRAEGQISFKRYGRAAAEMSPLDAARLVIAVAGSTFAKDSADVLKRFANLKPLGSGSSAETLEVCLEKRIDELPLEVTAPRGCPPLTVTLTVTLGNNANTRRENPVKTKANGAPGTIRTSDPQIRSLKSDLLDRIQGHVVILSPS